MPGPAALIYATFPNPGEAERVGGALVDRGLAACVNILPGMTSIYVFEGRRCRDSETVLIVKSRAALAERVVAEVKSMHTFTNPAIMVLPVAGGSQAFLAWIDAQTARPG